MSLTLIIIAITCVVSFSAFNDRSVMDKLILWPPAVAGNGQYHRLITYGLVHADFQHLLFNMITLFFFGRVIEQFYGVFTGALGFVFFYVSALLVSILPTYLKHKNDRNYRSLGASGAVSAVLFAFILLKPWAVIYLYVIPVPAILYAVAYVAYSIYSERQGGDNINHSAHLWGAAYGVAFTLAIEPRVFGGFLEALTHPGL